MSWLVAVVPVLMFGGVLYLLWRTNAKIDALHKAQIEAQQRHYATLARGFATIDRTLEGQLAKNSQALATYRNDKDLAGLSQRTSKPWPPEY